jgi:hypothetical protein
VVEEGCSAVVVEVKMLAKEGPMLVEAVADEDNGSQPLSSNFVKKVEQGKTVGSIKTLAGLVEDEQLWCLDQGPGDKDQALLGKVESAKRDLGQVGQAQPFKPGGSTADGRRGRPPVETDGVVKTGEDCRQSAAGNTVIAVKCRGNYAYLLF